MRRGEKIQSEVGEFGPKERMQRNGRIARKLLALRISWIGDLAVTGEQGENIRLKLNCSEQVK